MNASLLAGTILVVAGIAAGLIQLWFAPWSAETFVKIEMTLGGLLAIVVVVWFAVREHKEDQATRSGDRLD
jgi:fucose permease